MVVGLVLADFPSLLVLQHNKGVLHRHLVLGMLCMPALKSLDLENEWIISFETMKA